jgi:ABC-2 type transport system ATP-binding protein
VYGQGRTSFEAVRGIDLDVPRGSITALLGTNGAGKTSTLELIEGLAEPSGGQVRVLGLDPVQDRAQVRRRTGVLLQRSGFSGDLTVAETLRMWAATLTHARPIASALAMLDLTEKASTRVRALSGGEQRRLDLACTLMGDPELVLLDEPTTGLDPESRREVWRLVRDLRESGATVLLTTHYLDEAEALADQLAIMHEGLIVREGTPAQIVEGNPSTISFVDAEGTVADRCGRELGDADVTSREGRVVIRTADLQVTLGALLRWADREGVRLAELAASAASLESVFLQIADSRADIRHRTRDTAGTTAGDGPTAAGHNRANAGEGSLR